MSHSETMELIEWYMRNSGGYWLGFLNDLEVDHIRLGQAFFNNLHPEDQLRLTGTSLDPFHLPNGPESMNFIRTVLEFLTSKGGRI